MSNRRITNNLASFVLHIVAIWVVYYFKSTHIFTPSRSDGITVSLVSQAEIVTPQPIVATPALKPDAIKVTDTNNSAINLKEPSKNVESAQLSEIKKPVSKPTNLAVPLVKRDGLSSANKKPNAKLTNDLIKQLGDPSDAGRSNGKAIGGSQSGTSDTSVMVSNYADLVINAIRPYIEIPKEIDNNATAIIKVVLLPNMKVYQVNLKKSSGNPYYDNSVEDAVKKLAVFPSLPSGAHFKDFRVLYLTFKPE